MSETTPNRGAGGARPGDLRRAPVPRCTCKKQPALYYDVTRGILVRLCYFCWQDKWGGILELPKETLE